MPWPPLHIREHGRIRIREHVDQKFVEFVAGRAGCAGDASGIRDRGILSPFRRFAEGMDAVGAGAEQQGRETDFCNHSRRAPKDAVHGAPGRCVQRQRARPLLDSERPEAVAALRRVRVQGRLGHQGHPGNLKASILCLASMQDAGKVLGFVPWALRTEDLYRVALRADRRALRAGVPSFMDVGTPRLCLVALSLPHSSPSSVARL